MWFGYVWIVLIVIFWLCMTGAVVWDMATSVKKRREGYPDESLFSLIIASIDEFICGWIALNFAVLFVASLIFWIKYH